MHTGPRLTIESTPERAAREAVAREICATCPALLFCELYALEARPTSGIWAGRTPTEIAAYATELDDLEVA
ncbi:WhiB family transcriptional regulator [Nonomuraea sp. NPDC048892]|uniref:WhiB family transcriptional regulator n=1 Tax=Nonomuraea sp. NPDC048892 TaxID=3154624 RepID=UPI0034038B3E